MPPLRAGEHTAAPSSSQKGKVWTARELGEAKFAKRTWIIPDLLPTGLTVLAGKSKVGKSWLALCLALSVAHGRRALGRIDLPGPAGVLYLDLESYEDTTQERLLTLDDNLPDNLYCAMEWRRGEDGCSDIAAFIDEHPDVRMVVIDVWQKFRAPGRGRGRTDAYVEAYEELVPLQRLVDWCPKIGHCVRPLSGQRLQSLPG